MSKLKIELDSYKEFFGSEHGIKLITEIIEKGDYDAIEGIVRWKYCSSNILDKIAIKFMVVSNDEKKTRANLQMLEAIADTPKVSVETLGRMFEFAIRLLEKYSCSASNLLEAIAESKKLNEDLAQKLYNVAMQHRLNDVIEDLAENKNTPDAILFNIIDKYGAIVREKASVQIVKRYRELKEQPNKKEDE